MSDNRKYPYGIDQAAGKLADILLDHAEESGWTEEERQAAWDRLEAATGEQAQ